VVEVVHRWMKTFWKSSRKSLIITTILVLKEGEGEEERLGEAVGGNYYWVAAE